ncbi:MAG: methyltransferase domain-containing protein [Magnetococcales bacterium]|nr:methyltransferase domain-containing protein [Magnetococcales bacterium]
MNKTLEKILVCPGCHAPLRASGTLLQCTGGDDCPSRPREWPLLRDVPILLDESRSVFTIREAIDSPPALPNHKPWRRLLSRVWHARPGLSRNVAAHRNFQHLAERLAHLPQALVLVVGCGDEGDGICGLLEKPNVTAVGLDIRVTPSVAVLADAQQLPFADESFDAVVLQGVLEHIFDPFQVEREVFRTLKPQGLVYSELPFMQPNHGGAGDVIRFTWTGHRRFWRRFEQLDAGACCGPGMALAHMCQQFARALLPWRAWRVVSDWATDWLFWWLKYLDGFLVRHPAGIDGASAFYFLGRKSDRAMSDLALIDHYRGAQ